MTQTTPRTSADPRRAVSLAGALVGLAMTLGACQHAADNSFAMVNAPADYRQRHPIAVTEADRSIVVFVGRSRGGLTAEQRAEVMGMAQDWIREGTGAVTIDVPADTPNARTAQESLREIQATFTAAGVPPRGILVRKYHPEDPRQMPAIRVNYPKMKAVAGPCGLWPEDLGPSIHNGSYIENKQYYNFGCANQRNLAAMIEDPTDLVQPRAETPAYTARRNIAFDKYRKGTSTATTYPEADRAKLSDTGK
ncbi:CpaD family pilus assembly protein [Bradyrhizobium viridifuturi]|jgi:pilus assembly protein CpaD|uniref:CpaD family pilus assembly protein n=2 Tax=Nitrobacteraceae TaxID=41294 RepID=UPI000396F7C3|nr:MULTISPECIES: CpaD family pilus assembly protein [Bradyrhizobium]ERF83624.1 MAG: pilus (Caulobacter type) biogenesis lipoprotein CpaD [Bradyrhizobium sp. DFCI-1]OYU58246.1 MAG: pilus assembly protein CpaD [Bradyrhizobium sp. PARBB1]PSO16827.1 pilus assembly protein CpaD [Bradyrhizobium sp. MOS004]QRI70436.1 CpaD family pilus assembly protein [Bradyrhizobium sp. PSBB068]MBR1022563.1 CpaD family pilus assembly protein [Bradyrhizobium viridifuturi]